MTQRRVLTGNTGQPCFAPCSATSAYNRGIQTIKSDLMIRLRMREPGPNPGFWSRTGLRYDFGLVEVSTDGGSTWSLPEASYTGSTPTWVREQIDLAAYAGNLDVRVRFRLVTDSTVSQDGWYIDDVLIVEGPDPVALDSPVITPS